MRAEIAVDGRLDEDEWHSAFRCADWLRTQPFALDAPRYAKSYLVATEEGLAAGFILAQPPQEQRVKPRTPRDSLSLIGDSVSLMVDFDATGQVGYEFSVALGGGVRDGLITNQNRFDRDWDGSWQHAVRETDDQWFVEMLIPWSTVSKRESGTERRTVSFYAARFLFERTERYACPGITSESAAFLSDFRRIEIAQFQSQAQFDFIPYATVISDLLNESTNFKAGADIGWNPSPNFRLAATLNPDFGQVESDELVVDFSAIETVYTDKRPFFTENQGIFDLSTPANGQLVYTRRVGAAPDDGSAGSSDIDGASEGDRIGGQARLRCVPGDPEEDYHKDLGRQFAASRVALPFSQARLGYLGTWTDRPALDRDALVNAIDYEITPNDWWRVAGQVIRSDIGRWLASDGYEAWLQTDLARSAPLSHTLKLLYIDDEFDLNDLGYMERNSLEQVEWDTNRRVASASAGDRITGETQRLYLLYRENTLGNGSSRGFSCRVTCSTRPIGARTKRCATSRTASMTLSRAATDP